MAKSSTGTLAIVLAAAAAMLLLLPQRLIPHPAPLDSAGDAVTDVIRWAEGKSSDSANTRRRQVIHALNAVGAAAGVAAVILGAMAAAGRKRIGKSGIGF